MASGTPGRATPPKVDPEADLVLDEVVSLLADLHEGAPTGVSLDSDLAGELGLDSLAIVELHDRLQRRFGVTLPEEVLASATTPGEWFRAVVAAQGHPMGPRENRPVENVTTRAPGGAWPVAARTLTEALAWHVEEHSDLVTIRLLCGHDGSAVEELTYATLAAEAEECARALSAEGIGRGERVAIMLPPARGFFVDFLGTLLAGGVPVPLYPPIRPAELEAHLGRQARLLDDAGASVLIAEAEPSAAEQIVGPLVPSLRSVRTPAMLRDPGGTPLKLLVPGEDDTALIQYTSGSTGDPRGAVLTHAQLLANVRALGRAAAVNTDDVFVSWLPLYHDMGLIGAWHAMLYFGLPLVLLSPLQFLARPASWLEAISAYRGTLSAAPNFAYQLCVDLIGDDELAGLDLSRWRLAINGSEPVSALTLERFIDRFAACGFRRQAMCPAYGLAEVGLGLTFTPLDRGPRVDSVAGAELRRSGEAAPEAPGAAGAVAVVGCGMVLPGYEVRVADHRGNERPDRHEGRVECRGPSATAGYFGNERAGRALWRRGWLDTGDLGYIAEGELFLTGRAKDLIIRGGRNIHPEELERALGELDGARRGGVAVFASADPRQGTEQLVVVAETDLEAPEARSTLEARIVRAAVALLGAPPDQVVLVPGGAILRTASGKIRRAATREAFESGTFGRRSAPTAGRLALLCRSAWESTGGRLHDLGRAVATRVYAAYVWALVALIGVPLWVAVQLPGTRRSRWVMARAAGRCLVDLAGIDLRVQGCLPPTGSPAVIVSNHSSFVDAAVLLLTSRDPVDFVTSTDLERSRLAGPLLRRLGCVFVHRDRADRSVGEVAESVRLVDGGHRLVVFPEGSITRAPGLRPFRLGAFTIAAAAGCPVVPVGIRGTRDIVRPGTYLPRRGAVEVVVGVPILATGDDFAGLVDLAERARRTVGELSREPQISWEPPPATPASR